MKNKKVLFLMILILINCTGCTIEYNINITKDNIKETIIVNDYITDTRTDNDIMTHYNQWYPTYVNYIPPDQESIELENFNEKVKGIEYHDKKIEQTYNGYKYTYNYKYPINKYYDSYVLASTFIETTIHKDYNSLVLKTSKENLLCQYNYFDLAKINITIDPEIYKLNYTNTSDIKNNTYTWTLDRTNCNKSEIVLTLDTINNEEIVTQPQIKNNDSKYAIYIFFGILLLLIFIGYYIFKKFKEKNEKFNLDD